MKQTSRSNDYILNFNLSYSEMAFITVLLISIILVVPTTLSYYIFKLKLLHFIVMTFAFSYFMGNVLFIKAGNFNIIKITLNLISCIFAFLTIANITTNSNQIINGQFVLFNVFQVLAIVLVSFIIIFRGYHLTSLLDIENVVVKRKTQTNLKALDEQNFKDQEITQANPKQSKLRDTQFKIKTMAKGKESQIQEEQSNRFKAKDVFSILDEIEEEKK